MGTNSITMDFIDGREYAHILRTAFKQEVILVANIAWHEGIKSFVREATDAVFVDTAMSAFTLIAPADVIGEEDLASSLMNQFLAKRKRIKAKPFRQIGGTILKNRYRNALSAYTLAKKNTKVLELSLRNSILQFDYKVSAWQISQDFDTRPSMADEPIILGFQAFQATIIQEFSDFEKKIKSSKYLDPFSNVGVKITSKVTG